MTQGSCARPDCPHDKTSKFDYCCALCRGVNKARGVVLKALATKAGSNPQQQARYEAELGALEALAEAVATWRALNARHAWK